MKEKILQMGADAQASVLKMVSSGDLSITASVVMTYMIDKGMNNNFIYADVSANDLRSALGIKSPSVGYKYVNECIDAGVLDAIKEIGKVTQYRVCLDKLLQHAK